MQEIALGSGLSLNTSTGELSVSASAGIVQTIGVTVDGSGGTVTQGIKGYLKMPYGATITGWTVIASTATAGQNITFDIWRSTTGIPTTAGQSLVGGGTKPNLPNNQQLNNSANVTGWSTALATGDYLAFRVDSAQIVSYAVLEIYITRT